MLGPHLLEKPAGFVLEAVLLARLREEEDACGQI
jgi:hypothetical protein